jgi:hypothetical protein
MTIMEAETDDRDLVELIDRTLANRMLVDKIDQARYLIDSAIEHYDKLQLNDPLRATIERLEESLAKLDELDEDDEDENEETP